jgi:hypothetical protein
LDTSRSGGGPGRILGDSVVFATISTDVGREVVFGQALFRNTSDTVVTVDEVGILGMFRRGPPRSSRRA